MVNSPVAEYQMPKRTGSSAGQYQEAVTMKNVVITISGLDFITEQGSQLTEYEASRYRRFDQAEEETQRDDTRIRRKSGGPHREYAPNLIHIQDVVSSLHHERDR
jgi:hypothetical protein